MFHGEWGSFAAREKKSFVAEKVKQVEKVYQWEIYKLKIFFGQRSFARRSLRLRIFVSDAKRICDGGKSAAENICGWREVSLWVQKFESMEAKKFTSGKSPPRKFSWVSVSTWRKVCGRREVSSKELFVRRVQFSSSPNTIFQSSLSLRIKSERFCAEQSFEFVQLPPAQKLPMESYKFINRRQLFRTNNFVVSSLHPVSLWTFSQTLRVDWTFTRNFATVETIKTISNRQRKSKSKLKLFIRGNIYDTTNFSQGKIWCRFDFRTRNFSQTLWADELSKLLKLLKYFESSEKWVRSLRQKKVCQNKSISPKCSWKLFQRFQRFLWCSWELFKTFHSQIFRNVGQKKLKWSEVFFSRELSWRKKFQVCLKFSDELLNLQ